MIRPPDKEAAVDDSCSVWRPPIVTAASRLCTRRKAPGRQRRLTPEQKARFVKRVKAGGLPGDGVSSLRGPRMRTILDREFGTTLSLNGISKLLNRHGLVCLRPRPRQPQQDPTATKAFKHRAFFVNRVRASRPRTKVRVWFQDEAALIQEAKRSHRSLRRAQVRFICNSRQVTRENHV